MLSTSQKVGLLYKHYLGAGSTRDNREFFEEAIKSSFVVKPDQLWMYGDRIPNGTEATGGADAIAEIVNLGIDGNDPIFYHHISEDQDKVPLVKRYVDLQLTMVDKGTDNAFLITDENGEQIKNIVPFNYYEEYYNFVLKTSDGIKIPFGVGDWTVDTYSGVVTFYGELPDGVDHNNPPLLSFYQYVGGNGFRQDTYGYDGAILPLDSVEIAAGSCVLTNGSEGRTLYQHICDKANEIQDDFADVFGFDGADANEGIALSFEKIIPLTYTASLDAVKGYDKSADSEIGTLLSDKLVTFSNDNYEIVFASQKCSALETYTIKISDGAATGCGSDGEEKTPAAITGNEWGLYKVWVSDNAFVVLKVINAVDDELTFTVKNLAAQEEKTVTCLLLYWSNEDKQYQPFLPKEDVLGNFGFPVVTINGRLPPSVQLGTAALATFSDVITPDYYGPRSFAVVVAKEDGADVKSADYIVKNREDWYLDDILNEVLTKHDDFSGTVFLRAGTYQLSGDFDLSSFKNIILSGEGYSTVIDLQNKDLIINPDTGAIIDLVHIKFINVNSISITNKGQLFISDLLLPKETPVTLNAKTASSTFLNNLSLGDIHILGDNGAEAVNVQITGCTLGNVVIDKDQVYLKDNTLNELTINVEDTTYTVLRGNVINTLKSKHKNIFIDTNMIYAYSNIPASAANQIPVGTDEDYEVQNFNKDILTTTGRFPIFDKDDFLHMKYAEFASPLNYNASYNLIELLYDAEVLKIVDGKLTTVITTDRIGVSDAVFERHENSGLPPVAYDNSDKLNDIFEHLYKWKADLDEDGKVPLQELPDSVAYGGLLYVGTWSFEKNSGNYPTFSDATYRENISEDKKVDELQKGWFFIVEEAEDSTDSDDDNDTPVAEQEAVDGTIFTAGDWVIYVGDGADDTANESKSWQKIDRAYSDPTYSPLPYYAKVPEVENLDWYWKRNRDAGALDLSNDTIIEAFKKVNDQLRKLEPKKPAMLKNVALVYDEEYPTVSYRKYTNGVLSDPVTKYDSSKTEKYSFHTATDEDGNRTYKELVFFGDKATVTVTVDGTAHQFTITNDSSAQTDGVVYLSAPQEAMTYADHGENFWKGFYVTIKNTDISDGAHSVRIAIDDIQVLYDDGRVDTYQFNSYEGTSNTITYDTYEPYFPVNLEILEDTSMTLATTTLVDRSKADACSGIRKCNLANFLNIPGVSFTLAKVYKDNFVPTGTLAEIRVLLNDEAPFCDTYDISSYVRLVSNENYSSEYKDLSIENISIPVTYENKNDIIDESATLDFYVTVYDLYNEAHTVKIFTYTGMRFDPTEESERVSAGVLDEDSTFKDYDTSFGKAWNSEYVNLETLFKIGELVDGEPVGVYQQPTVKYNSVDYKLLWTGQEIGDSYYGAACFNVGRVDDATGFVIRINGLDSDMSKYTFDKLSGTTDDILLQVCLIEPQADNQKSKVTSFLDANSPYDGFTTVNEAEFLNPVMYAGNSTAIEKRITFGRNKILSGEVYVRIGIKKDSGLRFTGIELVEEI